MPRTGLYICQTRKAPPHFCVVVNTKTEPDIFDIPSGRNNLFYTLGFFIYIVKKTNDGYIDQVDTKSAEAGNIALCVS